MTKPKQQQQQQHEVGLDFPIVLKSFPRYKPKSVAKPVLQVPTPSFREIDPPVYPPLSAYSPCKRQKRRSQRISEREEDGRFGEERDKEEGEERDEEEGEENEEEDEEEWQEEEALPKTPKPLTIPVQLVRTNPNSPKSKLLAKAAAKLGMQVVDISTLDEKFTHLVMTTNKFSFEVLAALACGAQIVNGDWLAQGHRVSERPYLEFLTPAARKKRTPPLLFACIGQHRIYVKLSAKAKFSNDQVQLLVRLGGGEQVIWDLDKLVMQLRQQQKPNVL
ncbi:hypothetical protein BASA81_006492 [Batrachochytrium salamandrivorans]|nr:hypothetical protein BASA81_006492 [Batrachochytrium salamandrivorans]